MIDRRRRSEAGFSLIETLVAMSLMSVSLLVLIGSFAQSQNVAGLAVQQAKSESALRTTVDTVRSSSTPYVACATTASYNASMPSGASITAIVYVPAGTGPGGVALVPVQTCAPGIYDSGIQRITVRLVTAHGSTTRVLFKGRH